MSLADYLGLIAGAVITGSLIPQLVRVFRLKSAREISRLFTILLLVGAGIWLAYGLLLNLTPVIFWNAVTMVLVAILLYFKLKFG